MKTAKVLFVLAALLCLSACDYIRNGELDRERSDRAYRTAMDDYRAGRIRPALEGLRKVCASDPANASARFQLACLLQDSEKDFFGAYHAYHEYLQQRPGSDKAKLAASRLADCEREMASALLTRYGAGDAEKDRLELEELRKASVENVARLAKLTKDLEAAQQKAKALEQENVRLRGFMREETERDAAEASSAAFRDEAEKLRAEIESEDRGPDAFGAAEAKALLAADSANVPVLAREPEAQGGEKVKTKDEERPAKKNARPSSYVIQEGDTLYKIAIQFYGTRSAWKRIRDANKSVISTDGRVRAGQKIVLPAE